LKPSLEVIRGSMPRRALAETRVVSEVPFSRRREKVPEGRMRVEPNWIYIHAFLHHQCLAICLWDVNILIRPT
jgi:hypothetical protein